MSQETSPGQGPHDQGPHDQETSAGPGAHRAGATARTTADAATCYRLLADGSSWPSWLFVRSMELSREGGSGGESVGAVRIFRFGTGIPGASHEQVLELVPDRKFAYGVVGGLPIRRHRADVDLTPLPGGGTEISWAATWEPAVPGTGPLLRFAIRKLYQNFTAALAKKAADLAGP